jgi:hypothetical protein
MQFNLLWEAPGRPNGAILRYEIWIQYPNIKENETVCVGFGVQPISKGTYMAHWNDFSHIR